jgi:diguanylate cyclase (GGDEF)-like protein
MQPDPGKTHTANLLLPFALFGFLAPIATYLIAVSHLSTDGKTAVLSVLAGSYALLFAISYQRLKAVHKGSEHPTRFRGNEAAGSTDDETAGLSHTVGKFVNERGLRLVMEREIAEAIRNPDKRVLSLLLIDIRDFESLAGKHSPEETEVILEFAAIAIKGVLRSMDLAAHISGGRFATVLPTADETGAAEIARRIERSFTVKSFNVGSEKFGINVAIGTATFSPDCKTAQELFTRATESLVKSIQTSSHQGSEESRAF